MSDDLVTWLRSGRTGPDQTWPELCAKAADRIEVLQSDNAKLLRQRDELLEALREVLDAKGALLNVSEFPNCFDISEDYGREILALIARIEEENQ